MSRRHLTIPQLLRETFSALGASWKPLLGILLTIEVINFFATQLSLRLPALPSLLASLAIAILLPLLTTGLLRGQLVQLRGGRLHYSHMKSMLPNVKEVICLELLRLLFLFLWMLPGTGLLLFSAGFFAASAANAIPAMYVVGMIFYYAGLLVLFGLPLLAGLNYSLASCLLCDNPYMGGMAALVQSKSMMRGHRLRYLAATLPELLVVLGSIGYTAYCILNRQSYETFLNISALVLFILGILWQYLIPVLYEDVRTCG